MDKDTFDNININEGGDVATKWFMLIVALSYDGVQAILAFFIIGLLINRFISLFAWLHFYTWFKIKSIHVRGREMSISGVAEMIPVLGALPIWTGLVIWTMFIKPKLGGSIAKLANK